MFSKKRVRFYKRLDVRLTFWYTLTFMATIVALFFFLDYRLRRNLLKEIDRHLVDETYEIISVILPSSGNLEAKLLDFEKSVASRRYQPLEFRVLDDRGRQMYISSSLRTLSVKLPETVANPGASEQFLFDLLQPPEKDYPYRLCTHIYMNGDGNRYVLQMAAYLKRMCKTVENFRENLLTSFILSVVLGSIGGWLLSKKSLQPIAKIAEETNHITAQHLGKRLPPLGSGDELDRLTAIINDMLERLDTSFKKLTQFTADAAHELRTPIAALKGETEVILSKRRSTEEYRETLIRNLERIDFLTKLVNDLLLLSRMDEHKNGLDSAPLELNKLVESLWKAFNLVAEDKQINFSLEMPDRVWVKGDPIRLKRLFSNLIDNALKYTPRNGTIQVSVKQEADRILTLISDTGIGIPREDLPRLFDRFYRVDKSRSRDSGGVGLGLSISQRIVAAHQGTIRIQSQHHQGTTVAVTLPAISSPSKGSV